MTEQEHATPSRGPKGIIFKLALCALGVAINVVGSRIAAALGLSLYLDNIGTVLAAMLGGALPSVTIGYLTNIVNSLFDPTSLYYGVVSVLIALAATAAWQAGWFKKPLGVVGAALVLALIGGVLGSFISYGLYGFGFEGAITSSLAQSINDSVHNEFLAQMLADILVDIEDKAIVVACALVIRRLIPPQVEGIFDFSLWQQAPLSIQQLREARSNDLRGLSLRAKIVAGVSIIMVLVGVVSTTISYMLFSSSLEQQQIKKADGVATFAAQWVDGNKVNTYLEQGEDAEGYRTAERRLAQLRDSFDDVTYVYVYQIREDGCHVVFDPDTPDEPGSDLGAVVPFDQAFADQIDTLLKGGPIEPVISNESYGWLLSVYHPVVDDAGTCTAYAAVDVSMDKVRADCMAFLLRILSLFMAFFLLVVVLVLWLIEYSILMPLNSMATALGGCTFDDKEGRERAVAEVGALKISTGDEIERLYQTMSGMVGGMVEYVERSQQQAKTIARMQDNLILVMADLVESRDHYTGEHVRKTAAYTQIIMNQMRREGIYVDELTDKFVSDVAHSAPLHDIGKIVVPDAVLNKPGRLTDEEFKLIQGHAMAGAKILGSAVGAVSEPTYLDEARRLAAYHHERWNGTGYPTHVAGEQIPLSARIMAVADVFDALVSERSYKKGMPIDKALSIIAEGSGTHFDPQVAQAFLDAEDEVRRVAGEHGDDKGTQTFDVHDE